MSPAFCALARSSSSCFFLSSGSSMALLSAMPTLAYFFFMSWRSSTVGSWKRYFCSCSAATSWNSFTRFRHFLAFIVSHFSSFFVEFFFAVGAFSWLVDYFSAYPAEFKLSHCLHRGMFV